MQKIFIVGLIILSFSSYSQDRKLPLLVSQTEQTITHWLDSINKLSNNPYYKIKRQVAEDGDLILTCDYAINEEHLYKCLKAGFRFSYVKGTNICIVQSITGSEKYAQENLEFIRENFTKVSDGKWEWELADYNFKIYAKFERIDGESPMFKVKYELTSTVKK